MQTGDVNVTLLNASPELMCFFKRAFLLLFVIFLPLVAYM